MSIPKISIVIPTYNHAAFLKEALESVISQTFQDWECIVINNFSTDNTEEVVNSFQDSRIQLINFKNHGIIAASRNQGIRQAKTDWIAFLDSDDKWYPKKLEKAFALCDENTDLVCHHLIITYEDGKRKKLDFGPEEKSKYQYMLFRECSVSTSEIIVRKKCLEDVGLFDESQEKNTAEDWDLWLKLSHSGCRFRYLPEYLSEYRIHSANNSGSAVKHLNASLNVLNQHYSKNIEKSLVNGFYYSYRNSYFYYGAARAMTSPGEACEHFIKAIKLFPLWYRPYIGLIFATLKYLFGQRRPV